ncbi:hypothetical protein ACFVW8_12050 [Streptomyces sp. NPDC058221]|uniref:hypothetical protein n=1 Tax=Streptomyces sp. NPDC058221 TaxID=3346388 RepID=UPI0036F0C470
MHQPGTPDDLAEPERMWGHAVALALASAAGLDGNEYHVDEHGVLCETAGGSYWWRLRRCSEGRTVLYGQDSDGSRTHLGKTPFPYFETAPDWLPYDALNALAETRELGFVYWCDTSGWSRAPYPPGLVDDGLFCVTMLVAEREYGEEMEEYEEPLVLLDRVRRRTVDEDLIDVLLDAADEAGATSDRATRRATTLCYAELAGVVGEP